MLAIVLPQLFACMCTTNAAVAYCHSPRLSAIVVAIIAIAIAIVVTYLFI